MLHPSYAWRRRRRASAKPASPTNKVKPLAVSTTPLSLEVADPPAPVPGAPEGIVALASGLVVGTVGDPEDTVVTVIGGIVEDVVLV
jgi:hypothetical protein